MRRLPLTALLVVTTLVAAVALQALDVAVRRQPREPSSRTATTCPAPVVPVAGTAPVPLIADLDRVTPRPGPTQTAIVAAAGELLAGTIPAVTPGTPAARGDPLRYLFDQGVALRRTTATLGYAYAVTHGPRYLDALAQQTLAVVRWPDWNPGHPLDTAQLATDVATGLSWSRSQMTVAQRDEVAGVLARRFLDPYACGGDARLTGRRTGSGNQSAVVGSAAVLAALAVRVERPASSAAALTAGVASLERTAAPDGSGRSLADGPTDEGLMYTTYAAAAQALVESTLRLVRDQVQVSVSGADSATAAAAPGDADVVRALEAAMPSFDALADWNEHCALVADPAVQDGWDVYPWVDRTTALAAMAAAPQAGPHLMGLLDTLQAQARLTIPGAGAWPVPDGLAELVLAQGSTGSAVTAPASAPAVPPVQAFASGGGDDSHRYGCATSNGTYALLTGVPDDAPHAHADVGNVVVRQGDQEVLTDLGQRDYSFPGTPDWRASTEAHSTIGVRQADGSVRQEPAASGAVTVEGGGLLMTSSAALPGISAWTRRVVVADGNVEVHDVVSAGPPATGLAGAAVPLSTSWLLAAPLASVVPQAGGSLRVTLPDGEVWDLVPPAGASMSVQSAAPLPPYVDGPSLAPLAARRTLVVLHADVLPDAPAPTELVTTLHRVV